MIIKATITDMHASPQYTFTITEPLQFIWDVSSSHSPFSKHVVVLALVIRNPEEQHVSVSSNSCRGDSLMILMESLI